jgi:mannose-1-phosphate guanylyltransferase
LSQEQEERGMPQPGRSWAIVLAAGEGSRLQCLTRNAAGVAIPKQFCSLRGGASLLHEALRRAESVCDRERICVVVAAHHRPWWAPVLAWLPRRNVIVQPRNRGTGNGILLPLLHILRRDPQARIILLPSDHHVRDEHRLEMALRQALGQIEEQPARAILLGIEPDEVDPGLGYILPGGEDRCGVRTVERFVEKPTAATARVLLGRGALWNAFILAARARTLLGLFNRRFPEVVGQMRAAVARDARQPDEPRAAAQLYERLPDIDFSRHVAQGAESALRVLTVASCGWSDLGTPARVARTLEGLADAAAADFGAQQRPWRGQLSLAVQQAQAAAR